MHHAIRRDRTECADVGFVYRETRTTAQRENRTEDVKTSLEITPCCFKMLADSASENESYFGGRIRKHNIESTADFLMWLHEADQLGIKLTKGDITQEIADETGGITAREHYRDGSRTPRTLRRLQRGLALYRTR